MQICQQTASKWRTLKRLGLLQNADDAQKGNMLQSTRVEYGHGG